MSTTFDLEVGPATLAGTTRQEKEGNKHARVDDNFGEDTPRKKAKVMPSPNKPGRKKKVKLPRPAKVNVAAKAALKEREKEALLTHPKWKTLTKTQASIVREENAERKISDFKPRLWTGNKEELLAILPELTGAKCVNGVSWLSYENPMLILNDSTTFFEVNKIDDFTIDLITTRSFTCPVPAPRIELDDSLFNMNEDTLEIKPMIHNGAAIPVHHDMYQLPPGLPLKPFDGVPPFLCHPSVSIALIHGRSIATNHPPALNFVAEQLVRLGDARELLTNKGSEMVSNLNPSLDKAVGNNIPEKSLLSGKSEPDFRVDSIEKRMGKMKATVPSGSPTQFGTTFNHEEMYTFPQSIHERDAAPHWHDQPMFPVAESTSGLDVLEQHPCTDSTQSPVPSPIPQELQVLIDAYICGKPITIISSNERLYDIWSLLLPNEYGYVTMGYYRILGVQESLIQSMGPKSASKDFISGQVQWKFRLLWSPGGEVGIWPNRTEELKRPWWSLSPTLPEGQSTHGSSEFDRDTEQPPRDPEDDFPTTPRYRKLRETNPEYGCRTDPLQELYNFFSPSHLSMPFSAQLLDADFPRGWICRDCGRINFQGSMRRRKCSGSACKDSEPFCYYLDLLLLRGPQDGLPLALPSNTYPNEGVQVRHTRWEDGTQTFSSFMPDANTPDCYIKHIFTGNMPDLQKYANEWLTKVQLHVDIVRKPGDNDPYFSYSASCHGDSNRGARWPNVPDCINDMKDVLLRRAKWLGQMKEEDVLFNRLDIISWLTSGSKKHSEPIRATNRAVVLSCLGCNIIINVIPRSRKLSSSSQIDVKEENSEEHTGWITRSHDDDAAEGLVPSTSSMAQKTQATLLKKAPFSHTFTLVHGDMLVFFGDDFEYSIKRDGTSFMLMGSYFESE